MKTVLITTFLSLITTFAMASQDERTRLLNADVTPPEPGSSVCQAYVGAKTFFLGIIPTGVDYSKGVEFYQALPSHYCHMRKRVGDLYVIAAGDIYTYKANDEVEESSEDLVMRKGLAICRARAESNEDGHLKTFKELPADYCSAGEEFTYEGELFRVEVAGDVKLSQSVINQSHKFKGVKQYIATGEDQEGDYDENHIVPATGSVIVDY